MEDIRELYITGKPIDTEIGQLYFIKVNEYDEFVKYMPYLDLEKFEVINAIKTKDSRLAKHLSNISFVDIIKVYYDIFELYEMFKGLFKLCFKEDVFDKVMDDVQFEYYRSLIRKINCINHEKKNPNPEIERFNQYKREYDKKKSNGGLTFEAVYTSVGLFRQDVDDLTLYKLYAYFNRIAQMKNNEAMTLYNSVTGSVNVEAWYKHIDLLAVEEKTTLEEYSRDAGQILPS
jgi:hypothetical protein